MHTRTVYRIDKAGSMSRLKPKQEELSPLGPTEVRVAVKAIGLNFADIFAIWGLYSATPEGSFIPGLEYAGIIEAIGKDVSDVKVGDKIMGVTRFGAYSTHLNIDHRYILPLPTEWDFDTGAAFLVQVLTAYYALIPLGALQEGQTVLIHSAAGGVGLLANRIAKKYNAFTIGSIGSPHKTELLEKEGYNRVIVRSHRFANDLAESLGERELNLVLECIGGDIFKASFAQLAPMGRLVSYGSAQYASPGKRPNYLKLIWHYLRRPRLDAQNLINQNKSFLPFNLIHLYQKVEVMHELLNDIQQLDLEEPLIGHTFDFGDLHEALTLFQSGKTVGKVIIRVK